jgi:hypothetical protein
VNNKEILEMKAPSVDEAKRMRTENNASTKTIDGIMRLSIRNETPTFLLLSRHSETPGKYDTLHFQGSNNQRYLFSCTTVFPDPKEDFLFYLALAGSSKQPGIFLRDKNSVLYRVSVTTLLRRVLEFTTRVPQSSNHITPSYGEHEALTSAAFFIACSAGSLHGCTLEELLTRYVAELITQRDTQYPALTTVDKIPLDGDFTGRFAFPYDTELPHEVYQVLHAVQLSRPAAEECVDAVAYIPDNSGEKCYEILVEAKSTTKSATLKPKIKMALQRQDSNARVSFIVVDKFPSSDIRFNLEEFEVLNRNEKDGRKHAKGEKLDARLFYVKVDKSKKVVLQAIDGKPEGAVAKRVIFVISLAEIDRNFHI